MHSVQLPNKSNQAAKTHVHTALFIPVDQHVVLQRARVLDEADAFGEVGEQILLGHVGH